MTVPDTKVESHNQLSETECHRLWQLVLYKQLQYAVAYIEVYHCYDRSPGNKKILIPNNLLIT